MIHPLEPHTPAITLMPTTPSYSLHPLRETAILHCSNKEEAACGVATLFFLSLSQVLSIPI